MFRAHVLIMRRSQLHYTASGIITLKQVNGLKLLKYNSSYLLIFRDLIQRSRLVPFVIILHKIWNVLHSVVILIYNNLYRRWSTYVIIKEAEGTFYHFLLSDVFENCVCLCQYLTNLMHKICFTISFISCLYMFRAHVLIIRRSKLHYTPIVVMIPEAV